MLRYITIIKIYLGIGDWGLGIGELGLAQSTIPNPQSPIPNPQSPNNIFDNPNKSKNEILIRYKIYKNENPIKIFGYHFFKNKKDNCK